jgi:MerR family redox-sensitive transcriptional activator SoxR
MSGLTIGVVAREVGLHTSAIRYYEHIGLLPPAARQSGQRRYDRRIVERLRMIRIAQQLGFSLGEVRILLDGFPDGTPPSQRWQHMAETKLAEIKRVIVRATLMQHILEAGLDCTCPSLDVCLARMDDHWQMECSFSL